MPELLRSNGELQCSATPNKNINYLCITFPANNYVECTIALVCSMRILRI